MDYGEKMARQMEERLPLAALVRVELASVNRRVREPFGMPRVFQVREVEPVERLERIEEPPVTGEFIRLEERARSLAIPPPHLERRLELGNRLILSVAVVCKPAVPRINCEFAERTHRYQRPFQMILPPRLADPVHGERHPLQRMPGIHETSVLRIQVKASIRQSTLIYKSRGRIGEMPHLVYRCVHLRPVVADTAVVQDKHNVEAEHRMRQLPIDDAPREIRGRLLGADAALPVNVQTRLGLVTTCDIACSLVEFSGGHRHKACREAEGDSEGLEGSEGLGV